MNFFLFLHTLWACSALQHIKERTKPQGVWNESHASCSELSSSRSAEYVALGMFWIQMERKTLINQGDIEFIGNTFLDKLKCLIVIIIVNHAVKSFNFKTVLFCFWRSSLWGAVWCWCCGYRGTEAECRPCGRQAVHDKCPLEQSLPVQSPYTRLPVLGQWRGNLDNIIII